MAIHTVKLLRREEIAVGTMAFHFESPTGLQFKPGQYLDCTLLNPPETDAEGDIRSFSIASAPAEDGLTVATRMRDTAFKRVLQQMPLGSPLQTEGPMGSFTLHGAARPAVFLAGGIGITPFRSMIRAGLKPRTVLFYFNRRPEDAAFLQEFRDLEQTDKNLHCVGVMTGMEKSSRPWSGETGHFDKAMLMRHVADLAAPIYYVAGPPKMVNALKETLTGAGVNEDDIRSEDFAGY